MMHLKKDSSVWIKTKGLAFRYFHWQDGYGAFSINRADLPGLKKYLSTQREHHGKRSFQEEFINFLLAYGIEYDERYVWDCLFDPFRVFGSVCA
jgi:putative transposase